MRTAAARRRKFTTRHRSKTAASVSHPLAALVCIGLCRWFRVCICHLDDEQFAVATDRLFAALRTQLERVLPR